jgi:tRNA-specific 2-thiouridylase
LVSTSGEVLGRHDGVHHFTIGQRKGLGLAAGRPLYVVQIEPTTHCVVVGNEAELLRDTCHVRDVNWIAWNHLENPVEAMVKIRYRHEPAAATIEPIPLTDGDTAPPRTSSANSVVRVRFRAPQRAITPGQAAVFYSGDRVLGGGWIS